jgi:hypothetical protein
MATNLYQSSIQEMTKTIEDCLKNKEKLACLILFYSTIDIMAWLSRDPHDADSTREDFIRWVEEFLLPGTGLDCKGEDLYAARCAVIRSYAQAWGSSQNYKIAGNKIHYIWGKVNNSNAKISKSKPTDEPISIPVESLVKALQTAIQRFNNSLIDNRAMFELINERSKKFFI